MKHTDTAVGCAVLLLLGCIGLAVLGSFVEPEEDDAASVGGGPTGVVAPFQVKTPKPNSVVYQASITVEGTGRPGSTIVQDVSMGTDKTAVVDSSGKWRLETAELEEGDNQLTFHADDAEEEPISLRITYRTEVTLVVSVGKASGRHVLGTWVAWEADKKEPMVGPH